VALIDSGSIFILVAIVALPIAGVAFAFAGSALKTLGKGRFAIEQEPPPRSGGLTAPPVSAAVREAEIRQMVEAKSYRRVARGEAALDVEAEVARLLEAQPAPQRLGHDAELREEVRQLVVARNERRMRRGDAPLDVESEVQRQLRDLENLGQ
jgi:hypothetical protein